MVSLRAYGLCRVVSLVFTGALAASLVSVSVPGLVPARAGAQPPGASLTWLLDPAVDPEIQERIDGQTADLALTRVPPQAAAPATLAPAQRDPFAYAALLVGGSAGTRSDAPRSPWRARVVVWVHTQEQQLVVTIVDLEGRRVLLREVALGGSTERSAALETVGIIVRGALQTLAEGGEIGVRPPPEPAQLAVVEEPQADPAGDAEPPAPLAPTPREWMLGGGLLLRALVDQGLSVGGRGGLSLRWGRLFVGASVEGTVPQRVGAARATFAVGSVGATVQLGALAWERGRMALVPRAALSLGRVRRETPRVGDGVVATRSVTHLDVRAGAGLLWRVALGDAVWLALELGLEVPLARVRYSLGDAPEAQTLGATPRLGPVLGVSVLARVGGAP